MKKVIASVLGILYMSIQPLFGSSHIIHHERSLYRNIVVTEKNGVRCLRFVVKSHKNPNQSCKSLKHPQTLIFEYSRAVFMSLLFNAQPENILVIGLGGGSIPETFSKLLPEARIDIVEIDSAVLKVAKRYFGFKESAKMQVILQDGRIFIRRALAKDLRYDLIVLDAFNGDYIPEHLTTLEFLQLSKALLSKRGIIAANTFSSSRLYHSESVTYQHAFGDFFNIKLGRGNRIIIANTQNNLSLDILYGRRQKLTFPLKKFGINLDDYISHIQLVKDWNEDSPLLTDQYSPANLLQNVH